MIESNTYPVHLRLAGQRVLVVGGGNVAINKIAGLRRASAAVTVVAPEIREEIRTLDDVLCIDRPYARGEVASYRMAITCTDDREVNAQVFADGEAAGVWVNSADDPENCRFILPAVARQGDLAITISTAGRSPALATWMRRRFEKELDETYDDLVDVLATIRAEAREQLGTSEVRGWTEALDDGAYALVSQGQIEDAKHLLRSHLGLHQPAPMEARS